MRGNDSAVELLSETGTASGALARSGSGRSVSASSAAGALAGAGSTSRGDDGSRSGSAGSQGGSRSEKKRHKRRGKEKSKYKHRGKSKSKSKAKSKDRSSRSSRSSRSRSKAREKESSGSGLTAGRKASSSQLDFDLGGGGGRGQGLSSSAARAELDMLPFTVLREADVTVIEAIDAGAFGMVARGMYGGREVAVKSLLNEDPSHAELDEFFNEVAVMARVSHPNVVEFIGAVVDLPVMIVTEFCAGGDLSGLLFGPEARAFDELELVRGIASGMAALHAAKVVHRDLKPKNVLLTADLVPKIADFGFAKTRETMSRRAEQSIVGSPFYVAPEVVASGCYSSRCDVFSYASVVWTVYAKTEPFSQHAFSSMMDMLTGICEHGIRAGPISRDWHILIQAVIERGWNADADARPSFDEIVQVLNAI
ncbi:TKL/SHK protein kinase [Thecamonas trahens ATCC 50062]|uniref:TKL/SHK protein kinase n=1 Tax=Thecamonas trahens ATCC 50062 TaxID=461836 RepID=A0A0L0DKS2_THETB|nr:TKL/SHK protein kinase [Thecamonas trahens ATCC 50062]KNC51953.1 TKL/SHK protein kinase [Thecamonas trahens ATCC 50062]|eukprot:XP_013755542.1 TKL/SHK protein kinase [Thecamonas trahens ATCC 50062]